MVKSGESSPERRTVEEMLLGFPFNLGNLMTTERPAWLI
jgi:hypothetical protein